MCFSIPYAIMWIPDGIPGGSKVFHIIVKHITDWIVSIRWSMDSEWVPDSGEVRTAFVE